MDGWLMMSDTRFVMPAALVICNDIFAYVCGFFWGRTPLIQLSPKKTVEGFVGGFLCTLVLGFIVSWLFIVVRNSFKLMMAHALLDYYHFDAIQLPHLSRSGTFLPHPKTRFSSSADTMPYVGFGRIGMVSCYL